MEQKVNYAFGKRIAIIWQDNLLGRLAIFLAKIGPAQKFRGEENSKGLIGKIDY